MISMGQAFMTTSPLRTYFLSPLSHSSAQLHNISILSFNMKQYSEGILQIENMLLFAKIKWYDKVLFN